MSKYNLDPQLELYLQECAQFVSHTDDWQVRRDRFAESGKYFSPVMPGITVTDESCQQVPVRLYQPVTAARTDSLPTIMYLHGGGWCVGDHTTHDWFVHALLSRLDARVIAVGYRLAPEHPFPAPLDDARTVWEALSHGHWHEADTESLAVVGDSAGATLAAGLCVDLHDRGRPQPRLQGLLYPLLTRRADLPSMHAYADAPLLSAADVYAALALYAPDPEQYQDARALPLDGPVRPAVAPAYIVAAQYDPLADHARTYANELHKAGVAVEFHMAKGMLHGGLRAARLPETAHVFDGLVNALGRAFAAPLRDAGLGPC
ncbi:alpha/beta hydrolase [Pseudomonas putida]|uniref:alpha/beta hydrolase n=1 Tax=Pseudomonas putida TaxID=303 RepID=UPI002AC59386|nr:alpha/beta hydrolase [Pseudomonas putida]MDZ5111327.1 alpha/beta hydrolase [Pseudomonas putida]